MRSMAFAGLVAACLIVPGVSRAEARAVPAGVQGYQQGGEHERQEERRENRVDSKEAKRQLKSARAILNRIEPERVEGISRDSLEQVKARFADLYNDFNHANGQRNERERRDWQADYDQIERMLDNLTAPERGEGSVGTSGHRYEEREERAGRDDLARFRDRLEAFYTAAAGHQWRREERR